MTLCTASQPGPLAPTRWTPSPGALVWHVLPEETFYGSPAVTGPAGQRVLVIGSKAGNLYALDLATGATVWTKKPTWGFWGSPAVSQGAFYVAGLDGMLRSYAPRPWPAGPGWPEAALRPAPGPPAAGGLASHS